MKEKKHETNLKIDALVENVMKTINESLNQEEKNIKNKRIFYFIIFFQMLKK